ncbi:hypothetical protein JWV37_08315 [Sulfurospirillum sp. T05]|uniref:Uncharacterized protein n=1 Tax=Sulfurospirillum tamanense TaxID=2813362 RepID=A0ABS2WT64_9BACT|nr:hypothetical protein [Sulfurospirillum tamanensis]MBN2964783.1 hypothetical protein [Sulfurospirillum tamanensis]
MLLIIPLIAAIILAWTVDAIYFSDTEPKKRIERPKAPNESAQRYLEQHIHKKETP